MAAHTGRRRTAWYGALLAMTVALAGCTSTSHGSGASSDTTRSGVPTAVGTVTHVSTITTTPSTRTITQSPQTVTESIDPSDVQPPSATPEPNPVHGDCPYLKNEQVKDANGQHTGVTSVIDTKPYPVCIFTRSDGGYLATTRIVVADTPAEAAAAVNQHVPVDKSNPATHPSGWSGGAMGNLDGVEGYPKAASIYAVAKGTIAIIAISNQKQSIKGRQMVQDIVANLGL